MSSSKGSGNNQSSENAGEEVLLLVPHVRHRKVEGALYVMGERIAWMIEGRDQFAISHWYANIKSQKISPEAKEKVQLQIVPHTGEPSTFHFVHPEGRDKQVEQRNEVKEMLQQLLPRFRQQISSELEDKKQQLMANPRLFQLYKDLVVSKVLSSDHFWASVAPHNYHRDKDQHQQTGVSGGFWSTIKPSTSTSTTNGITYNLTLDAIESIFKTFPTVKAKHLQCVPGKMSEHDFWTLFFQSHYFHRDRISSTTDDSLFSDCAQSDEVNMAQVLGGPVSDPLLDVSSLSDVTLPEGYGGGGAGEAQAIHSHNLSMIRRFNYHSSQVLNTCLSKASVSGSSSGGGRKRKIEDLITYEDLDGDVESEEVRAGVVSGKLCLTDQSRYSQGPPQAPGEGGEGDYMTLRNYQAQVERWRPRDVLQEPVAISVIGEVTPGGKLMRSSYEQHISSLLPQDVLVSVAHLYSSLLELLRHFWACFPVTSPTLEDKMLRCRSNLEKYHTTKLRPFSEQQVSRGHHNMFNLTKHMEMMVQVANSRYQRWQQNRSKLALLTSGGGGKR